MTRVFVSGCFDLLHAGHIQFFADARALGDHLTVCFASPESLWQHKRRRPSIPPEDKRLILQSLWMVDEVVIGGCGELGLDFEVEFRRRQPDLLVVTPDDRYGDAKRALCRSVGCEDRVIPKRSVVTPVSTSDLVRSIRAPVEVPLRVDFAGGWLDVPRLAREGAYVVNCAIEPMVSIGSWDYERHSGLGGSGAHAILEGRDPIDAELELGAGWQDPAVILETGLCVWRSGRSPVLDVKRNGDLLDGLLALWWTGSPHDTPALVDRRRDYEQIVAASHTARAAVLAGDVPGLAEATAMSYRAQLDEGMPALPDLEGALARKDSCGSGWGGYALYVFASAAARRVHAERAERREIEPFTRT